MFNQVSLGGKTTEKYTFRIVNGTAIYNGTITVDDYVKKEKKTYFIKFTAFGKKAELLNKYLTKGTDLNIHGKLTINTYEIDGKKFKEPIIIIKDVYLAKSVFEGIQNKENYFCENDINENEFEDYFRDYFEDEDEFVNELNDEDLKELESDTLKKEGLEEVTSEDKNPFDSINSEDFDDWQNAF
ncbi:hypothetical protein HMPREF1092_03228 [Clostridium thermobutyricum]|uniref:Single-stranded DNA-binding protein n=1 Tax=Clostridium thermobutyricum TaxID=29372 RepID=N9XIF4_9CLOT|nr:single-stranded DNA-binding protein [Clostridium thermobutyricum]ENY99487.1 hypothetical protein HMPREF1092_03228 [Clostridium thermobutyricum]